MLRPWMGSQLQITAAKALDALLSSNTQYRLYQLQFLLAHAYHERWQDTTR